MDPDAIKARNPCVVLVDELAAYQKNIPGSKHRKRYEDVLTWSKQKWKVLSTVNVQHLESSAPTVAAITGIKIGKRFRMGARTRERNRDGRLDSGSAQNRMSAARFTTRRKWTRRSRIFSAGKSDCSS